MASSSFASPPWSSLPQDVLLEILQRLTVIDRCRFRAVCRCWSQCCGASSLRQPYIGTYQPYGVGGRPQVPWLMAPVRRGTHHAFYDVGSPSATFRMTHLPQIRFVAGTSPGGWVLHVDGEGDLHALNVLTGEALRPPPLTAFSDVVGVERDAPGRISKYLLRDPWGEGHYWWVVMESYYVHALIAFPEGGASRGRFVVAVIHGKNNKVAFAWEGDESWTDVDPGGTGDYCHLLLLHDGLIYAVHANGPVLRFDPRDSSTFEILRNRFRYLSGEVRDLCHYDVSYLFELEGELWMVSRSYDYVENRRPGRNFSGRYCRETMTTPNVAMYKLDKLANIWFEMKGLGAADLALFLGSNQSLVLSTRDFPQLQSGFIYFTDNNTDSYESMPSIRNIGAFDLEKKTFHAGYHWCLLQHNYPAPVWMLR